MGTTTVLHVCLLVEGEGAGVGREHMGVEKHDINYTVITLNIRTDRLEQTV